MYRVCFSCNSNKTYVDKNGCHLWRVIHEWFVPLRFCNTCYHKYYSNKKRNPETTKKWHDIDNRRKIKFLGKRLYVPWDFRKHVCEWCNVSSSMTDMHHLKYIPCMPWACTVELCRKCHHKTKEIGGGFGKHHPVTTR